MVKAIITRYAIATREDGKEGKRVFFNVWVFPPHEQARILFEGKMDVSLKDSEEYVQKQLDEYISELNKQNIK